MYIKAKKDRKQQKVNPLNGILLLIISIILLVITGPIGVIYGLLYSFFTRFFTGLGEFCLEIAISIDQLGNVIMQHLLNLLWLKKDCNHNFGNRDETISSVIGKNLNPNKLTWFGNLINSILDIIEKNHSLNSIDYNIEPRDNNTN